MTLNLRLIRAIALALGLGLPIVLQAAPACVSQNDAGTSEVPVIQAPGGTGGTGVAPGGVGGTGIGSESDNGGIGGTGIVGTITGFASICVNGLEVHFSNDVPVSENGI